MSEPYRDETSAALHRAEVLERENQRLRAALEERGLSAPASDDDVASLGADGGRFGGNASLVAIFAVPALGAVVIAVIVVLLLVRG